MKKLKLLMLITSTTLSLSSCVGSSGTSSRNNDYIANQVNTTEDVLTVLKNTNTGDVSVTSKDVTVLFEPQSGDKPESFYNLRGYGMAGDSTSNYVNNNALMPHRDYKVTFTPIKKFASHDPQITNLSVNMSSSTALKMVNGSAIPYHLIQAFIIDKDIKDNNQKPIDGQHLGLYEQQNDLTVRSSATNSSVKVMNSIKPFYAGNVVFDITYSNGTTESIIVPVGKFINPKFEDKSFLGTPWHPYILSSNNQTREFTFGITNTNRELENPHFFAAPLKSNYCGGTYDTYFLPIIETGCSTNLAFKDETVNLIKPRRILDEEGRYFPDDLIRAYSYSNYIYGYDYFISGATMVYYWVSEKYFFATNLDFPAGLVRHHAEMIRPEQVLFNIGFTSNYNYDGMLTSYDLLVHSFSGRSDAPANLNVVYEGKIRTPIPRKYTKPDFTFTKNKNYAIMGGSSS